MQWTYPILNKTKISHRSNYHDDRNSQHLNRPTTTPIARSVAPSGGPLAAGGAWIGGVILIGLGMIFLLQNTGALYLQNWWALFILLPALGSFGESFTEYRVSGRFNARARGSLVAGLVFTAIASVFLFNLNFSLLLPIILIVAGVGILFNTVLPD